MEKFTSFYEKVIEIGIEHDHHESDLYVPVTTQTKELVNNYEYGMMVTTFKSEIDGNMWYDIPFEYIPYWEAVANKGE